MSDVTTGITSPIRIVTSYQSYWDNAINSVRIFLDVSQINLEASCQTLDNRQQEEGPVSGTCFTTSISPLVGNSYFSIIQAAIMRRQDISNEDQYRESENDENETLVSSLASTYGSLSSVNMPSGQEVGNASAKFSRLPSVLSESGMISIDSDDDNVNGDVNSGDDDISSDEEDDENEDDDDDDDDSEISYEDSSEDEERALNQKKLKSRRRKFKCKVMEPVITPILKLYRLIRDAIILITNTDDVWDSPAFQNPSHRRDRSGSIQSYSSASSLHQRQGSTRRMQDVPSLSEEPRVSLQHKIAVLFWFLVLAAFYALERVSFKIMADRMGPFRMVVGGEVVLAVHALIGGAFTSFRWICRKKSKRSGLGMLPLADVALMAVLDTIQLLLVVISGSHVAPILTAILVHVTIPMTTYINTIIGPKGCLYEVFRSSEKEARENAEDEPNREVVEAGAPGFQSSQMLFGATLIMLSSILALAPALLTLTCPSFLSSKDVMADRSAWNTLLFFVSYIPGAISQSFKEKTLEAYAQPVDQDILNAVLSLFSAIFAFLVSPLFYPLQGFADLPSAPNLHRTVEVEKWIHQYPSKDVSRNFRQGLQCLIGTLDNEIQVRGYPEQAHCDFAYGFVLLHVFSIIVISYAVGKICNAGAFKVMHRGISAGIIVSIVTLFFYQVFVDNVDYGVLPSVFHITCAAVLVMGSEVYHRVTLESPSFETQFPPVAQFEEE